MVNLIGILELYVQYYTGDKEYHSYQYVRDDESRMVAEYIT